MKKLVFLFLISLFSSGLLYAQSSATLQLRGIVTNNNTSNNISVSYSLSESAFIDLRVTQSMVLGAISLLGSQENGYSITISSRNGGRLRGMDGTTTEELPYSLSFAGYEDIDLTTGFTMLINSRTQTNRTEFPLRVNFQKATDSDTFIAPGVYEDIITITFSAP